MALRAGSAAPRRTLSDSVAEAVNSAQEYSFFGQLRAFAADGIMARVTGEEAMESPGVIGMPLPVPLARSSQRSESGSQIW